MTKIKGVLLGCSALAGVTVVSATQVDAQQQTPHRDVVMETGQSQASTTSTASQDTTTSLGDASGVVPANSDAAEEEAASDNAANMSAKERAKAEQIVKYRRGLPPEAAREASDITVTGSRLHDGDQTSRLTVIDAQEIRARGVTSVEELIRTLPQNIATIGAITNDRTRGPLRDPNKNDPIVSSVGSLGVSAANLGGVGAGNTLILVNGRRIAGAAGIEQGYANLNGIPLSAIERVEISTEGASAIYGADALGGVINFILKHDYVGTTASIQHEFSSGGANNTRANIYSGYAWGSGSISATIDYTRREPIVNRRTGYVTNNYAPTFGGNPAYDKRSFTSGLQPGVINQPGIYDNDGTLIQPETGLTVRPGLTGAPSRADFVQVGLNSARDFVPTYAGPASRSISGTLSLDQKITNKLRMTASGLYTRTRNTQESQALQGISLLLGPGQYYNPFSAGEIVSYSPGTRVAYYPGAEIADGTLPAGEVANFTNSWNASFGASYDFDRHTKLQLIYTASGATTSGNSADLGNLVTDFVDDPQSATGYSCYSFDLANGRVEQSRLGEIQAAFRRQCLAQTSSDPAKAFNPWKSSSSGGGSSITDFLYVPLRDNLGSTLQNIEARLSGSVGMLPAGRIDYAVGGEYVHSGIRSARIESLVGSSGNSDRHALFGEVTVPLLGNEFSLPLVRRLLVNFALRRDVTSSTGAVGTINNVPIDAGGQIIYARNRFGRTTPAFGVRWSPFNSLDLRTKFTRGFKAPPPTQLFTLQGSNTYTTFISDDPLYQCTNDCAFIRSGIRYYTVPARVAPNPDLRPETSQQQVFSGSWQPTGFFGGLSLALTYNRNRIRNQFATISDLQRYVPVRDILRIPQFYPRDAKGKVISQQNMTFNIIGSDFESLTFEASYILNTGIGTFQPKITVVDNLVARTIGTEASFVRNLRGTILGVDKYRAVGTLQWTQGPFGFNIFVYHTPSYVNDYASYYFGGEERNPELITRVRPFTTADVTLSWVANRRLNLQFAGRNIIKSKAPFTVVDNLPYDTSRYNVAGRTLLLSAQLSF